MRNEILTGDTVVIPRSTVSNIENLIRDSVEDVDPVYVKILAMLIAVNTKITAISSKKYFAETGMEMYGTGQVMVELQSWKAALIESAKSKLSS